MANDEADCTSRHWEKVYQTKATDSVSWFEPHATVSLRLIEQTGIALDDAVIDVGGGASTLVDDLLAGGYSNLSVLDIAESALDAARWRLGAKAGQVSWIAGDITTIELPENTYSLWHDRAVFHFLVSAENRQRYIQSLIRSVKPGGHVIIATFAEDGPEKCSGLPVRRYSAAELKQELGESFVLHHYEKASHQTPTGALQRFSYCWFKLVK